MAKRKMKTEYKPQALKVYWEEERYGETKTAVLCDKHRQHVFNRHPNARGAGEYFPVEKCERCQDLIARSTLIENTVKLEKELKWLN
jgi:hypothetical protein